MAKPKPQVRIVPQGLRRIAQQYRAAGVAEVEEAAALLDAVAHLLESIYNEGDARAATKSAEAALKAARRHAKNEDDKALARRWFDEWQSPQHRRTFANCTDYALYVVAHTKFTSVEHWAKQASKWIRESA